MGIDKAEKLRSGRLHSPHQLARLSKLFHLAQRKIEQKHFQGRRMLLHQEKLRHEMQQEMGQDPYLDTAGA